MSFHRIVLSRGEVCCAHAVTSTSVFYLFIIYLTNFAPASRAFRRRRLRRRSYHVVVVRPACCCMCYLLLHAKEIRMADCKKNKTTTHSHVGHICLETCSTAVRHLSFPSWTWRQGEMASVWMWSIGFTGKYQVRKKQLAEWLFPPFNGSHVLFRHLSIAP